MREFYQTIVNTFQEFEWTFEQTKNPRTENTQPNVRKISIHT